MCSAIYFNIAFSMFVDGVDDTLVITHRPVSTTQFELPTAALITPLSSRRSWCLLPAMSVSSFSEWSIQRCMLTSGVARAEIDQCGNTRCNRFRTSLIGYIKNRVIIYKDLS